MDDEINGLINVSEIAEEEEVTDATVALKAGDKVKAKIISIDPEEHRVALSIKAMSEKPAKKKKASDEETDESGEEKEEKKGKKEKKAKKEDTEKEEE